MSDKDRRVRVKARGYFDNIRRMVNGFSGETRSFSSQRSDAWEPPMDVYETRDTIVMKLSIPGIKASDVRIKYEGDLVTVCGHREGSPESELTAYHRMEIRNGYFERRIMVRKAIDPERAEAEYVDGFLRVRIPKVKERKKRVYTLKIEL
ncbi:MAG: Hsp20/alpha crystallin family protein [Planctomycetota bacterium]